MDTNRQVDVSTILNEVSSMLAQNQGALNQTDAQGTHGQRVAQAFQAAAQAASQVNTNDAGQQLSAAADAMREQGSGKAISYYANGLEKAAQQFSGQTGITLNDL